MGETFTIAGSFGGEFEATYLGLADLGTAEIAGPSELGDVQCYAILGEATLVTMSETGGAGLSTQRAEALAADGTTIEALPQCPESPLREAGYTSVFGLEWTEGVTKTVYFDLVAVPVGDEELLDRVSPYPALPEFELEATVTETIG